MAVQAYLFPHSLFNHYPADFQIFYEGELLEGVALLDDQGVPNELLGKHSSSAPLSIRAECYSDTLSCKVGHGNVAECELVSFHAAKNWLASNTSVASTTGTVALSEAQRQQPLLAITRRSEPPIFWLSNRTTIRVASLRRKWRQ